LIDTIADRCTEVESGARNVDNILTNTLLPEMSRMLLKNMASGEAVGSIRVSVGEDGHLNILKRRSGAIPGEAGTGGS